MVSKSKVSLVAMVVLALTLMAVPALAHNLSGHYTSSDGCQFDWLDVDSSGAHAADMRETSGNSCDYVRAKIRVLESGSWVIRQDTDASHSYVTGVSATNMDYVDHNWANPTWKGFRKNH